MQEQFLEECRRELINGYTKKHHPFRYLTLATLYNQQPRQRTVILRKLISDFNLIIYTDTRSQKIHDIQSNSSISALFYHPKKLLQVKLIGTASLISSAQEIESYWQHIPKNSRKDYITQHAPGTPIKNPDHVEYLPDQANFGVLQVAPTSIEILQLKRPNHLRIEFTLKDGDWQGQFLVP